MEKVELLGELGYRDKVDKLTKGQFTTNEWEASRIMIIPTEEGYKLALKVHYDDGNDGYNTSLCEIKLSDDGVPYIDFGSDEFPYSESDAFPIAVYEERGINVYKIQWDKFIFDFRDPDTRTTQGRNVFLYDLLVGKSQSDYFDKSSSRTYYDTICLNTAGLLLLMKYIQDPRNKEILDRKFTPPSHAEIESLKNNIRQSLETIMEMKNEKNMASDTSELESKLYVLKDLVHRKLDTNPPIPINFSAYAKLLESGSNQFGQ